MTRTQILTELKQEAEKARFDLYSVFGVCTNCQNALFSAYYSRGSLSFSCFCEARHENITSRHLICTGAAEDD